MLANATPELQALFEDFDAAVELFAETHGLAEAEVAAHMLGYSLGKLCLLRFDREAVKKVVDSNMDVLEKILNPSAKA